MFQFLMVYYFGGRPDIALFKLTKGIIEGMLIDTYSHGDTYRNFACIDNLVEGIHHLIDAIPSGPEDHENVPANDSISPVIPSRVVNIGNSDKVRLLDFIETIEDEMVMKAECNYMNMQPSDVPATSANASLLQALTDIVQIRACPKGWINL